MSILIILGVIFYSIKIFKECRSPEAILARVQHPEHHPIYKRLAEHMIEDGMQTPIPPEASVLAADPASVCRQFAERVNRNLALSPTDAFWEEAKKLTVSELKQMMAEVKT